MELTEYIFGLLFLNCLHHWRKISKDVFIIDSLVFFDLWYRRYFDVLAIDTSDYTKFKNLLDGLHRGIIILRELSVCMLGSMQWDNYLCDPQFIFHRLSDVQFAHLLHRGFIICNRLRWGYENCRKYRKVYIR